MNVFEKILTIKGKIYEYAIQKGDVMKVAYHKYGGKKGQ